MQIEFDFISIIGCGNDPIHIFILDRDPASRDAFLRLTLNADHKEMGVSKRSLKRLLKFHKGLLYEDALRAEQEMW